MKRVGPPVASSSRGSQKQKAKAKRLKRICVINLVVIDMEKK